MKNTDFPRNSGIWVLFLIILSSLLFASCGGGGDSATSPNDGSPQTSIVHGRVSDKKNNRLAGVTITLSGNGITKTAISDSTGEFSIQDVPDGTYTVTPSQGSNVFEPSNMTITVRGADVGGCNFFLGEAGLTNNGAGTACEGTLSVSGRVIDYQGKNFGGVQVLLTLNWNTVLQATTDSQGHYTFINIRKEYYRLKVPIEGYYQENEYMITDFQDTVNLVLDDIVEYPSNIMYDVSGRILYESSNKGVSGITLWLLQPPDNIIVAEDVTDTDGTYFFHDIKAGSYVVETVKPFCSIDPDKQSVTVKNANVTNINFIAKENDVRINTIYGTITDDRGNGVGSVQVWLVYEDGSSVYVLSDTSGNYKFTDMPDGAYTVVPALAGYVFTPGQIGVTVSGGSSKSGIDFTVVKESGAIVASVTGRVVDSDGNGIPGVISAYFSENEYRTSTADSNGNYTITALTAGEWWIIPEMKGYMFEPDHRAVIVTESKTYTVDNFVATKTEVINTYTVSGTIRDSKGTAISNVTVRLSGSGKSLDAATDSKGVYSFTSIPNGTYTVMPTLAGYIFNPSQTEITTSGTDKGGVDFTGTKESVSITATVTGKVVDSSGNGVQGVLITASLSGTSSQTATTAADGGFTLSSLTAGNWRLIPQKDGYSLSPTERTVSVTESKTYTVDIFVATKTEVINTYTVSGTVRDSKGTAISDVTVRLSGSGKTVDATTDANGKYSFKSIQNGSYTITPIMTGFTFNPQQSSVTVSGADKGGVDFTGTKESGEIAATITGRVVDTSGKGVEDIPVHAESSQGAVADTNTDANGSFALSGIAAGDWNVGADSDRFEFYPLYVKIEITESKTYSAGTFKEGEYCVEGYTVNEQGYGMSGVTVRLSSSGNTLEKQTINYEDFQVYGVFIFEVLPGTYTVTASLSGYTFRPESYTVSISNESSLLNIFIATKDGEKPKWAGTHKYLPLAEGNTWVYECKSKGLLTGSESVEETTSRVVGMEILESLYENSQSLFREFWKVEGKHSGEDNLRIEDDNLYRFYQGALVLKPIPGRSSHARTALAVQEDMPNIKFNASPGEYWTVYDKDWGEFREWIICAYIGEETMGVPAGTFSRCKHYQYTQMIQDKNDEKPNSISESHIYFAPDVGKV
ncbi:carboxypeptidase regulatory-like domain-containing protein, partial [bacterium]|nr:carboxypeptidase regulatory-like domain-containing protein [bacterium]